jgi:hypothetical protein
LGRVAQWTQEEAKFLKTKHLGKKLADRIDLQNEQEYTIQYFLNMKLQNCRRCAVFAQAPHR